MSLFKASFYKHVAMPVTDEVFELEQQLIRSRLDEARAFLAERGIKDVKPLIKVSRKRLAKIQNFT
jgi:hypothetical protein